MGEKEMQDFKDEIRNDIKEMTQGINKLADVVNTVFTQNEVNKEKDANQREFNDNIKVDLDKIKIKIENINTSRSEEKQARDFLMKYWPWFIVVTILSSSALSVFMSISLKSIIN